MILSSVATIVIVIDITVVLNSIKIILVIIIGTICGKLVVSLSLNFLCPETSALEGPDPAG